MTWLLVLFVACQPMELLETTQSDERHELNIQGVIDHEYQTRANDEGFVDGDRMGVFVVDYENGIPGKLLASGNRANNMCYTYNEAEGSWSGAGTIYWRDENTPVDVYGYYPFENVVSSVEDYPFEVMVNQNQNVEGGEMSYYESSDFLWAKTPGAQYGRPITLTYEHLMAGVQVFLEQGTGFTDAEWNKLPKIVTVDNTVRKATIDLSRGVVVVDGAFDFNIILSDEGSSYRGVVVPQSVDVGKSVISVTIDGVSYSLTKNTQMTYVSGRLHKFTIRVDKRSASGDYELTIVDEQIAPWENDESSHNFEGKSYVVVEVANEGTLRECMVALGVDVANVKNLKISGHLTNKDFEFLRSDMKYLQALNLKEVKLCSVEFADGFTPYVYDDALPNDALRGLSQLRSLILPDNVKYISPYSLANLNLTSTLVLPESATHFYGRAFEGSDMDIVLPNAMEFIGGGAFAYAALRGELKLPNTLKHIGQGAFYNATGFYGVFNLPPHLEYVGANAFKGCGNNLEGEIIIPEFMTSIPEMAFNARFKNRVDITLHAGVKRIEGNAFAGLNVRKVPVFPEGLEYIGPLAFSECFGMKGELSFPKSLKYLGTGAFFGSAMTGILEIPEILHAIHGGNRGTFVGASFDEIITTKNLEVIGDEAFSGCNNLKKVYLEKNVNYIGRRAFASCGAVRTFVCLADEPPVLGAEAFAEMNFDHVILEVPDRAVELYRNTEGWNNFKYITAYHELAVGISEIKSLNAGVERSTIIRSEGAWEVESCPDWCTVTPMFADTKEDITIRVNELAAGAGDREGRIVFKLKNKDYTTYTTICQYDYQTPEDTEVVLQTASAGGEEIPIFIIGDGFGADKIVDGSYLKIMNQQMEYFFDIEPYRSYRDYFTVSTAVVHSPEDGLSNVVSFKESKFNSVNENGFRCDHQMLYDYVKRVSSHIDDGNIDKALIILMLNTEQSTTNVRIEDNGRTICFCPLSDQPYPYDQRGLIQHYAGGRGFGKLAQEDTYHYDFMQLCSCPGCNKTSEYYWAKERDWYDNVSLSSKMNEVPWSHLIFHEKYSQFVDVYEGGLGHARGVFRSEINSCMNTFIPYYNTISRESIVRRIMKYAGKEYSFEDFVENDVIEK